MLAGLAKLALGMIQEARRSAFDAEAVGHCVVSAEAGRFVLRHADLMTRFPQREQRSG